MQKYNCLFKFIIKKPKKKASDYIAEYFHQGYCKIPNFSNNNES